LLGFVGEARNELDGKLFDEKICVLDHLDNDPVRIESNVKSKNYNLGPPDGVLQVFIWYVIVVHEQEIGNQSEATFIEVVHFPSLCCRKWFGDSMINQDKQVYHIHRYNLKNGVMIPEESNVEHSPPPELEHQPVSSLSKCIDLLSVVNSPEPHFNLWQHQSVLIGEHYSHQEDGINKESHERGDNPYEISELFCEVGAQRVREL
jgi:hypothetical protein